MRKREGFEELGKKGLEDMGQGEEMGGLRLRQYIILTIKSEDNRKCEGKMGNGEEFSEEGKVRKTGQI